MILAAGAARRSSTELPYVIPVAAPYNVPDYLVTPTPDGTGSAVHPDVIDFGLDGWRGWRYWMALTPYYNNNYRDENPCILVSHDGFTWQPPPGLTNPIYPAPPTGWNSDVDLTYDPATDELLLVFRDETFTWKFARSSDGITWPATPFTPAFPGVTEEKVSPSLVLMPDGSWAAWGITHPGRQLYRWTAATPDGLWSTAQACTGFGPNIWHFNVVRIGTKLHMLMHEGWTAETGGSTAYAATSTDGLSWTRGATPVLIPDGSGWDSTELYRSALTPHANGTHMRVWYPGRSGSGPKDWHIGLTHIPLTEWPV